MNHGEYLLPIIMKSSMNKEGWEEEYVDRFVRPTHLGYIENGVLIPAGKSAHVMRFIYSQTRNERQKVLQFIKSRREKGHEANTILDSLEAELKYKNL